MGPAFRNLVRGRINEFVDLTLTFLRTRSYRSTQYASENVFQGVLEVLLDEPKFRMGELRLVVDGTKDYGDGRFGFVDIFISPMNIGGGRERTQGVVLELKNVTMRGLCSGEKGSWKESYPYNELEEMARKLDKEDEKVLLARKYMYKSMDEDTYLSTTVGATMDSAEKQLDKYMRTIALGSLRKSDYTSSGILDQRIRTYKGCDKLQGHVVMAIGSRRVLVRSTELISTRFEYSCD